MGTEDNCEYVYQSNTHTYGCIHCTHTEPSDLSITPSDRVVASKPHWIYLCPLPTVWGSLAHMTTSHISECQEFELKSSHLCSKSSGSRTHRPSPGHCLCVSSKGHWLGTEKQAQPQHHKRRRVPIPYQNETAECELSEYFFIKPFTFPILQ